MSDEAASEKFDVIPHQDCVTFDVWDDVVHMRQEGLIDGDQTVSIVGLANLDLIIAALQRVREKWS